VVVAAHGRAADGECDGRGVEAGRGCMPRGGWHVRLSPSLPSGEPWCLRRPLHSPQSRLRCCRHAGR
jgi:hypothetical protein